MESSPENSFTWTETSSDSNSSSTMATDGIHATYSDEKISTGKKTKKKHGKESLSLEPDAVIKDEKAYYKTRSDSSEKKKHIKIEQDSDIDVQHKKKRFKKFETNGSQNNSQDSVSYDESYLDLKVKQEVSSTTSSSKHKKKKKEKRSSSKDSSSTPVKNRENNSSSEIYDDCVTLKEETENGSVIRKTKKKKKSKKNQEGDILSLEFEEKMDVEDSVLNINADSFVTHNTTLQVGSEESGCDEISAIKCDDSVIGPTLSFVNNTIEEDHTKINCNLNIQDSDSSKKSQASKHRKQRISDRLRFEDDDDDNTNTESNEHENDSENNAKFLKLKQYLKSNSNLRLLPQTNSNNMTITQDDEIWILKCPQEINISDFDNTTLNIHGKCKIKVGGKSYEGCADEEQTNTISLLTMEQKKYKIRNVQLSGIINLRKRIPKAHFRDDNVMVNNQTNFIPLPETKCRHPLFGPKYKKALKIPAAIAERLNVRDTEDILLRTENRKRKKNKKETNIIEQVDSQLQNDFTMKTEPELSEVKEKKKKKRKLIDDEDPVPSKKVKRVKHDPESVEAWDSEKAIEENLFNF